MPESYNTLIIEDEKPARDRLKLLLQDKAEIKLIGEAGDGEEGLHKIQALQPDLIFLDIEIPVYNGFEMLRQLSHCPLIIFTTAYDQFALQAFAENSVDYLLKPIEKDRLHKAVEKLKGLRKTQVSETHWNTQLQKLLDTVQKPQKPSTLSVKVGDTIRLVRIHDITHLWAEDKYVYIQDVSGKKHLTHHSLTTLIKQLGHPFVQIHRACIINTDHILKISKGFKGRFVFTMGNKVEVSSGVTYSSALREFFNI